MRHISTVGKESRWKPVYCKAHVKFPFSVYCSNTLKEKESNISFGKLCFFFLIVWHRLKNQSTPKEGLTVLINEDKELAELRSLATGVGLANACYAIQYVTCAGITGHLDEECVRARALQSCWTL